MALKNLQLKTTLRLTESESTYAEVFKRYDMLVERLQSQLTDSIAQMREQRISNELDGARGPTSRIGAKVSFLCSGCCSFVHSCEHNNRCCSKSSTPARFLQSLRLVWSSSKVLFHFRATSSHELVITCVWQAVGSFRPNTDGPVRLDM